MIDTLHFSFQHKNGGFSHTLEHGFTNNSICYWGRLPVLGSENKKYWYLFRNYWWNSIMVTRLMGLELFNFNLTSFTEPCELIIDDQEPSNEAQTRCHLISLFMTWLYKWKVVCLFISVRSFSFMPNFNSIGWSVLILNTVEVERNLDLFIWSLFERMLIRLILDSAFNKFCSVSRLHSV